MEIYPQSQNRCGLALLDIKTHKKTRRNQVERLITKKVIAITVSEVLLSFAITRFKLNLRLACPNFPSIA
jgi:hypothetical protein